MCPLQILLVFFQENSPVVFCTSEEVERIPPDLTLYEKASDVRTESSGTTWWFCCWFIFDT